MVLLITIVFLLQIGLAYVFVIRFEWSEYLVPVTVGAMTLTILCRTLRYSNSRDLEKACYATTMCGGSRQAR